MTARHRAGEAPAPVAWAAAVRHPAPAAGRPRWVPRDLFVNAVLRQPADPALRDELRDIAPDTTDDVPLG